MANALLKVSKSDIYSRLKECIGPHWALPIIKVGIFISELSGEENRKKNIDDIKDSVKRKYGISAIKILHLGDTGVIKDIIAYL